MKSSSITDPKVMNSTTNTEDNRPLKLLLLVFGILAARWIWIAGIGDYGWNYELGMRVMQGEVPFRDYICTLPQLTSYTIVPFLAVLKGNLWAFSLHLYLWWFAALLVGLQVSREFGLRSAAQSGAMFCAACLSLPALHLGHAYSYAGTVFFGLTLLNVMKFRASSQAKHLLLAGVFAGVGLFAKQNIGGVAVILGLGVIVYDCVIQNAQPMLVRRLFIFSSGVAVAFLPIFAFFASKAGAREVFNQMFSDAGAGKGGLFGMIFHVIPFFFFTPETPMRQLWTLVISGGLVLLFLGLIGFKMQRLQKQTAPVAAQESPRNSWRMLAIAIGIIAILSAFSLFDLPQVRSFFDNLHPRAIYTCHGFSSPLIFVVYSLFTALAAICLLSADHWLKADFFLPIIALPLLLWGHELSCEGYLPFGAPVVVPLAVVLLETIGIMRNTVPLMCVVGVMIISGQTMSTEQGYRSASFQVLKRLPSDSKFANLWAYPEMAVNTDELHQNITPQIRDRSTLWICVGGPHLALGGKSVFSVAALHGDTYNLRSEPTLTNRWQAQPPEFVFVSDLTHCPGSQLFTKEALSQWLPQKYDTVWKSSIRNATLWQLRMQTNNSTH